MALKDRLKRLEVKLNPSIPVICFQHDGVWEPGHEAKYNDAILRGIEPRIINFVTITGSLTIDGIEPPECPDYG